MPLDDYCDPYQQFTVEQPELAAKIQTVIDKGRHFLEQGRPEDARREFQRALALYPHVPAALNNLALLAFGEGDRERAALYLKQVLDYAPAEPTANALLARYWTEVGALPLAFRHAEQAVAGVVALARRYESGDPSRARRACEFACQALAGLEDDAGLVQLYQAMEQPQLLPVSSLHMGIAHYNRGDFDTALCLWQSVIAVNPDDVPAQIYIDMAEVIGQHDLLPFRLDHRLDIPEPEKGRRVWLVRVPSLLIAAALVRVYRGEPAEAEEALPLLASVGLPGFDRVLKHTASDLNRPVRLRLLASLQLAGAGDTEAAAQVVQAVPRRDLTAAEEALWCLLAALVAEARKEFDTALQMAREAGELLRGLDTVPADHPVRQMLPALIERLRQQGAQAIDSAPRGGAPPEATTGNAPAKRLRVPDAAWLRPLLDAEPSADLITALARRPKVMVLDLARRLGEQEPDRLAVEALIRRLAMRLRSLPVERVTGSLSPAAKQALNWLAKQGEVKLSVLQSWLAQELLEADPWPILEELYRAGLVEIGRRAPEEAAELVATVLIELRGRF